MELSAIRRNTSVIEEGRWIENIPTMGSLRLKVRGMSSLAFQSAFGRLSRSVPKEDRQRDGSINPEVAARVMGEALHETVLQDWDGLLNEGSVQAYDAALAKDLLTNPEWRIFADAVVWAAGIVDNGRAEAADTLGEPSKPSSVGKLKQTTARR